MEYTPNKISGNLATFAVEVRICIKCKKDMVSKPKETYWRSETFPICVRNTFEDQAKRGGLLLQSEATVDGEYICESCKDAGKVDFKCCLCGKRYPTSDIYSSYGDPVDYLCKSCYAITPAKDWDIRIKELEEEHRYDFE